jgi:hypothetical protein
VGVQDKESAIQVTNAITSFVQAFLASPEGIALQVSLGWIVLDALLTAALEKKLNRFAPEAFSYFLEKIGGEYIGLLVLGTAAYFQPALLVFAIPALGAFVTTESNGAYQKISAFVASLQTDKAAK